MAQEASLQTRGRDWFSSLPLGTRGVFVVCCAIYALCVLLGYDAFGQVCMAPHWVLFNGGEGDLTKMRTFPRRVATWGPARSRVYVPETSLTTDRE